MLSVKFNSNKLNKTLNNTSQYGLGFLDGIEMEQVIFNKFLAGFISEALGKYIDSRARMNPKMLHHVYEPNQVGDSNARLFKFNVTTSKNFISFTGSFLPSKKSSSENGEPFKDKANIMENQISFTISPKRSNVLVFEDEGETVFTSNSIFIEHPGGDEVAGSFGTVVDDFFSNYLKNALLKPLISDLKTADEFTKNFAAGTKNGKPSGIKAGRKYLQVFGGIE